MNNHLVIICGYEGIQKIVGLFSETEATEKVKSIRAACGGDWKWHKRREEFGEDYNAFWNAHDAAMNAAGEEEREHWFTQPDQVCVMRVDETGAVCACAALGVEPSEHWLY